MSETTMITERLTIRPFADSDLDDLTMLIRDKMASEYAPYDHQYPTDDAGIKAVLAYFKNEAPWCWCAVALKVTGRVIGFVCAGADGDTTRGLGYTIRSDHQNNGYAYEACRALMGHCQNALGTRRFVAGTADCNGPSVKLLRKLGFMKIQSIEVSFAKDAAGNPIVFAAGKYERLL